MTEAYPAVTGLDLVQALEEAAALGASDLHLTALLPPVIRQSGNLTPLPGYTAPGEDALYEQLMGMINRNQQERFEHDLELDYSYQVPSGRMFRCNLFWDRGSISAAFRVIPDKILPLEELRIPGVVKTFSGLPRGLVLVCGPTGSGKSTTLAAIIDLANRTRSGHILTIEDPIEFQHTSNRCLVAQREVGVDTLSFSEALKHALRQDPDIILVGEMRDKETMEIALRAAETGHLVFATLHTQGVAQSINRMVDQFDSFQQDQIRAQLAITIQGVLSQTLCRRADGRGRVVATELLRATPAIRAMIRENKLHQIYSALHSGKDEGMHTLDQSLADLVRQGDITFEEGLETARSPEEFARLLGRTTRVPQGAAGLNSPFGRM
ncbi:MAG: type IV pilus twitching motility protein PilT [Bifidobacteriaceae bacterium]|jgi:twitching motility protein PilT|nr:type IV pilus twitching motility protein PilT [Bifidobacteriaceae bacterium]